MTDHDVGLRSTLRPALLRSVSLSALLVAAGSVSPARAAGGYRSLGQALASHPSVAVTAASTAGGATAANQAGLGLQNFTAAAARFRSLNEALAAQSYTGTPVPDGIQAGGLQQADGVAGGPQSTLWSGASTNLTQTVTGGVTTVTVDQTKNVAALTWKSFNVGAKTKLVFDQSAGGSQASNWIAINSLQSGTVNPSTILGQITAPGKVFILNPNGVLFGAGSQVNVGALVAATGTIAEAQLTRDTNGLITGFSLYGTTTADGTTFTPTFQGAVPGADIIVQPGAEISTPVPTGTNGGGYVMLLAATVQNGGVISTPQGQTVLAAGENFILQPGYSTINPTATVVGSEVAVFNTDAITGMGTTALGAATNTGIVIADQGDITMVGHLVTQAGVLLATTTVNARGTEHLLTDSGDATAEVVLAPGSVSEILPEELYSLNGTLVTALENPDAAQGILQTALDAQRATNLANSATDNTLRDSNFTQKMARLNDANNLTDTLGESRIEISTGGTVDMQGGALALAQGGQVAVNAAQSIMLDSGATVDVSGTNAVLPASSNSLFISGIVPYYLRDSAANRTGGLEFTSVYIDERTLVEITGGAYAGNIYTQGGLLEVSGNLGLIGHGINEWSSLAGQVTLQTVNSVSGVTTGGTVTVAPGATINLTGGTVTYQAGLVKQSYVQAADGQVYNINDAPGNLVYTGVYTGAVEQHARWHITQTFVNPLLTPSEIYEPSYTIGRDAGNLTVSAGTALVQGTIAAGVTVGQSQTGARPSNIVDPFTLAQSVTPQAGTLDVGSYSGGVLQLPLDVVALIASGSGTGGNPDVPVVMLPTEAVSGTLSLDSDTLNQAGFANISVITGGDLILGSSLTLGNGGTLTLGGATVAVDANVTAHDGIITLTNLLTPAIPLSSSAGGITLAAGARIDASGNWTNLQTDPGNLSLAGTANGGAVTLQSTGGVDLAAGSAIDVGGGGVLSQAGKLSAGNGGNISITADLAGVIGTALGTTAIDYAGQVTLDGSLSGFAAGGGGTLSISVPYILLGNAVGGYPTNLLVLNRNSLLVLADDRLLSGGFSDYVLNGYQGLEVDAGRQVDVTRTVDVLSNPLVRTGQDAAASFTRVLQPLFLQNKGNDSITQRAGASLALDASVNGTSVGGGGGAIYIDQGAHVTVDPRQSIMVAAYGQLTDLGTLTAHGGAITLANTRFDTPQGGTGNTLPSLFVDNLSVWIGSGAVVDASGQAVVLTDALGRTFGQSAAGGTIVLGGLGGTNGAAADSTYAQVIERPGALIDASGASVTVDVVPSIATGQLVDTGAPMTLAGNGGTIVARSLAGIAFDGGLEAAGAGAGAAGGSLFMRIDPQNRNVFFGIPASDYTASDILISQDYVPVQTMAGLQPGQQDDPATIGLGRISQQQIDAGGFDSLYLYAQDYIGLDGNVSLHLGRSVTLESGIIGETSNTGHAAISAPYVRLIGFDPNANAGLDPIGPPELTLPGSQASLTVSGDLVDISNLMDFGGSRLVGAPLGGTTTVLATAFGFADATIESSGDIRFLPDASGLTTILDSAGNITFQAAQIYPVTGAAAQVRAGDNIGAAQNVNEYAGGTITVLGQPGAAPAAPYSVGGSLALIADYIVQDGIIRAPEGMIRLGSIGSSDRSGGVSGVQITDSVTLGDGSITSVSLYGQTIPYGGTVDGVNYSYNGSAVGTFDPVLQIDSASFTANSGATIDLRGGGTLAGAGFIPGRGGSQNVNTTPLLNSGSGTVTANTTDQVFAIVPGYGAQYAPVSPGDSGYATPGIGEQITIAAGEVPGLAAGTYTLLPAYYDLLPGAYRVELTGSAIAPGTTQPFGNFTTVAAVAVGYANTRISSSVDQAALITSGSGVRQLSQFDEETYNTFEANSASTFGAPRPFLPQDAKTLDIELNSPSGTIGADAQPLQIEAADILKAPAAFTLNGTEDVGYGATIDIAGSVPLEVLGAGDTTFAVPSANGSSTLQAYGISAALLDAITAPTSVAYGSLVADVGTRLVLGGTLATNSFTPNQLFIVGEAPDVLLLPHADLTAADVFLTSSATGTIDVLGGATINTSGQGSVINPADQGYLFSPQTASFAYAVLAVSNADLQFTPTPGSAGGAIIVGDGATLRSGTGGSLDFVAPGGTNVQVGDATLAASFVNLQVSNINIGSSTDLADFATLLPGGLSLTEATLNTLASNATVLTLTADNAVNILGQVSLNSGDTALVVNSPAIYGYGVERDGVTTDGVTIVAPSFTWGGVSNTVASSQALQTTEVVSATPAGRLAGSTDGATLTTAGSLVVDAKTIDLGYGPDTRANDQVQLDRLAVGFTNVTFNASSEITANNKSSLSVYETQDNYGQPGTGGDLTLVAPLITAASGTVLKLTAGGTLSATDAAMVDGVPVTYTPAATGSIATQGAEIDLTAGTVDTATAIALPAGRLDITAQDGIDLAAGTNIDLSGRATKLFDQTVYSNGGVLNLEADASAQAGITEDEGATIDVSAAGAAAGSVVATALGGTVAFDGTLSGTGKTTDGSFSVAADTLASADGSLSAFDALNATLDAGGFFGSRSFELASGDILVDRTITAHTVRISADAGNVDVSGTINASGAAPGDIALAAGGELILESTAVLDAHATSTARDSFGQEIDAKNRAHVSLTSSNGSVVLNPGATINVSYPDSASNPQGQIIINAPRVSSGGGLLDVAVSAPASLTIIGARSIDLYAFTTYQPTDANGTIVQDNGTGDTAGSGYSVVSSSGTVGLVQIGLDNQAYMNQVNADGAGLDTQLSGLAAYGQKFNLLPGVTIDSSKTPNGNLTISGDLDFASLRYSDPTQYFGIAATSALGSGEPGSIVFRASNDLVINGSVSDGFGPPAEVATNTLIAADTKGWNIYSNVLDPNTGLPAPWVDPTNSDLLLPSSAVGYYRANGQSVASNAIVLLGASDGISAATTFDTNRTVSLNYAITVLYVDVNGFVNPAQLKSNVLVPFAFTVGGTSAAVPAGGWVATSTITRDGVVLYNKGDLIPAGFTFQTGDQIGAGAVLPVVVDTNASGQVVPAGTPLNIFESIYLTLATDTAVLPANALIPAGTQAFFGVCTADCGSETSEVVTPVNTLHLRPTTTIDGNAVQGYIDPLAALLPAGSQSWNMDFVAGANLAGAASDAVQPRTTLDGGAFATDANTINQAPGSLLIDDEHFLNYNVRYANSLQYNTAYTAFSVIRTGTGDLELDAGGNIDQSSAYGIYTAGTQVTVDASFEPSRQALGQDGQILIGQSSKAVAGYNALISLYQAYYPTDGGDVTVTAGGDFTGYVLGGDTSAAAASPTDAVGNWLWRQGSGSTDLGQPTAWWINFGTLVDGLTNSGGPQSTATVQLTGFEGLGTLGGGNVNVTIGGDAGQITGRDQAGLGAANVGAQNGEGLVIAVGATGRVANGTVTETGGGDLNLTVGGNLNPLDAAALDDGASPGHQGSQLPAVNGDLIDVRGDITATAGAIGRIDYSYDSGTNNLFDPRATDPNTPNNGVPNGGITIVPGDGTVSIVTDRDLVLAGAGDPGRLPEQALTGLTAYGVGSQDTTGGYSGFTLWQAGTSVSLFSAGGNLTPTTLPNEIGVGNLAFGVIQNNEPTDNRSLYPATLLVSAPSGNIIYGQDGVNPANISGTSVATSSGAAVDYSLETMPSPTGQIEFLAGKSIFANGYAVDISGAYPAGLATVFNPAFSAVFGGGLVAPGNILTSPEQGLTPLSLFAMEADTPTTNLHANDPEPARFYAADGDIVNFQTGQVLTFVNNGTVQATWYIGAKPVWVLASNDIVSTGTRPAAYPSDDALLFNTEENQIQVPNGNTTVYSTGDFILNNLGNDISVISAGRDILSAYAYIGGPGLLEVDAGRNIYQANYTLGNAGATTQVLTFGSIKSLGDNIIADSPLSTSGGADIAVLAGVGAGPDYAAFAALYFNSANQANLALPITDPANKGKVQQVYTTQLVAWLTTNYGYTGGADGALAFFQALPAIDQDVFVRQVYFEELQASGAQYTNPNSRFYKSYVRGKQAIDTLFPSVGAGGTSGVPAGYTGGITAYSGLVKLTDADSNTRSVVLDGGFATLFGGTVQVLDPGGAVELGIPSITPGDNSGIVTYGSGDIDIYSLGSVLLGQSRIFATGGGNIVIWSSSGDINAGIGAKTTISYNPPTLVYDDQGDVTQTPPDSTSGAGIATLQPLPSVPAGDVNLIAPAGTIDAGEAGIRVSGNLVLAASRVSGTANISVKGSTAGAPTVAVNSIGAVDAAAVAAGASSAQATSAANRNNQDRDAASILDVEVISIGGTYEDEKKRRKKAQIQ